MEKFSGMRSKKALNGEEIFTTEYVAYLESQIVQLNSKLIIAQSHASELQNQLVKHKGR